MEACILEEITSIQEVGDFPTIDIEVSGDRLFYANDILTHNCGYNNSDVDMSSIADSMGIVMTLDFFFALISTDELSDMNQVLIKVLKNRSGDLPKFVLGLNRAKMTFFDLESSAQENVSFDTKQKSSKPDLDIPVFDRGRRNVSVDDFKM